MARTQEDRSAGTQQALLTATVECLVEYGYAGTTTRLVADRAGVSRGAQTHHYPTKHELVAAAVEHLFDEHARGFTAEFERIAPEQRTFRRAVEALWAIVQGPAYAAILEVVVAARTDDELRAVVHAMAAGLEHTLIELLRRTFPEVVDDDQARRLVDIAVAVVQGAAVSRSAGFGRPDEVVELIASMADLFLVTPLPTTPAHPATPDPEEHP